MAGYAEPCLLYRAEAAPEDVYLDCPGPGRELIGAESNAYRCRVATCKSVVSVATPALLDFVEEPFDQIACAVRAEAARVFAIRFGGLLAHGPCSQPASAFGGIADMAGL